MKKLMRKLLAVVAAMTMVLGMSGLTAFAADGAVGDITVNKAVKDATYSAYKVFNATYTGSDAVSYTLIDGINYTDISGFSNTFDTKTNGNQTYVTVKSGKSGADVAGVFTKDVLESTFSAQKKAEKTNTSGAQSVLLETGEAGYYVIVSSVGGKNALTIDTAHPTATVDSKVDSSPTVPNDGKKINGTQVNTMEVGETGTFTLTFNATNYKVASGVSTAINSYTVTDTANGFDLANATDFSVTVNGTNYAIPNKEVSHVPGTDAQGNQTLTFTIPWDQVTYPSPSTVVITYKATLTNRNIASDSTNKFSVKANNDDVPGTPETHTYNYKVVINKYDGSNNTIKLPGAEFVLRNTATKTANSKYYKVATNGTISWVAGTEAGDPILTGENAATVVTTDDNGAANFEGLKAGTYYLVETKAPAGYNLLTDPTTVNLQEITDKENVANLTQTADVVNNKGTALPTTGGMGTTTFYILGAALVIGAGVVLVTRRRLNK